MDKDMVLMHLRLEFTETRQERGVYIVEVEQTRRARKGHARQRDSYTYRTPQRKGPDWNGERLIGFLELILSQYKADAALLSGHDTETDEDD
jgi:hypothetical protein